MNTPHTTYRIQFHKHFNFDQFEQTIGYLSTLGVDCIYASPILQAVPGSMHGYGGTDVQQINPEIGSFAQLKKIHTKLKKHQIKWLQDIVPNHMALHQDNTWLMDVFRFGRCSAYHTYFDTALTTPYLQDDRIMVPVLGDSLDNCLRDQQLSVTVQGKQLYVQYHDTKLPLRPMSYLIILKDLIDGSDHAATLEQRLAAAETHADAGSWKELASEIYDTFEKCAPASLLHSIEQFNTDKEKLATLLSLQHYRLCHWQETDMRINYRRFFTVNGLICLNMQSKSTFRAAHVFIQSLLDEGLVQGLRIDHIDGLNNPTQYLRRLRQLSGDDTYIIAEKILGINEALPESWPIQGTTGYEFLALSNNVCIDRKGKKKLTRYYEHLIGHPIEIEKEQYQKKKDIITQHMQGEIDNLADYFLHLNLSQKTVDRDDLKVALTLLLTYFPVYRLYDDAFPLPAASFTRFMDVFDSMAQDPEAPSTAVSILRDTIRYAQRKADSKYRKKAVAFLLRCMQFTGPVMAKGVEDTLMYTFNRFVALNEVGNHPKNFGIRKKDFHHRMQQRQDKWPTSLNASATHDTKRGEDARARLFTLSSIAEEWIQQVNHWEDTVQQSYADKLPDANDRYFVYQTLYAAHPMPGQSIDGFNERLRDYLTKYLREGKEHSDWTAPNIRNEKSLHEFADFLLDPQDIFYPAFLPFFEATVDFGIINSLAQLVLKFTCPGIPDIYQGTELWDLSFVDPDNRRDVGYTERMEYLQQIQGLSPEAALPVLWGERYNGKIKLWLLNRLIRIRQQSAPLRSDGDYIALEVKGKYRRNILAYARAKGNEWVVSIVPVHLAGIPEINIQSLLDFDWADTRVVLQEGVHQWEHALLPLRGEGNELLLSSLFKELPLAVLTSQVKEKARRAGILLPITALATPYGIGDLGSSAFAFMQQLKNAGQSYWQVLPISPISQAQYYSPYSTMSTMAGNPLLIDVEQLKEEGLLTTEECREASVRPQQKINYPLVQAAKQKLLNQAYKRVDFEQEPDFSRFCHDESSWLDDYALFAILHKQHQNSPWYQWPEVYRARDGQALSDFGKKHAMAIHREKWIQYIFFKQWKTLQQYGRQIGIKLIGDVPFYVGHDSADVWCLPQFFSLKPDGTARSIAGVPPDYFNAEGQLWGMPVYDWQRLRQDNYRWWMDRLKQQARLFDLVRLDHFRAFVAYWKVAAEQDSARGGRWIQGPGADFLERLKDEIPTMPFIAEDLGDIDATVYKLRDAYGLPGMRVLQFAFGEDMPRSCHTPHRYTKNCIVYTGTHDNNTLRGWYAEELDRVGRTRLSAYSGFKINKHNVHTQLIRMAYASVADTVIIPMQDILALDSDHRVNSPAKTDGNWDWQLLPDAFGKKHEKALRQLTWIYNR